MKIKSYLYPSYQIQYRSDKRLKNVIHSLFTDKLANIVFQYDNEHYNRLVALISISIHKDRAQHKKKTKGEKKES
jgi:hypothetical protein